jgi:hypothetical protein
VRRHASFQRGIEAAPSSRQGGVQFGKGVVASSGMRSTSHGKGRHRMAFAADRCARAASVAVWEPA